jgi:hypothetical protein
MVDIIEMMSPWSILISNGYVEHMAANRDNTFDTRQKLERLLTLSSPDWML